MLKNKSYKPTPFLSKYIDRFYTFEKKSSDYFELPAVLPGTGLELLFHLDKPLSINNNRLPRAHTVCPRKMFKFDKDKSVSFLSVRFKSGAFRHFCSVPFSELNDTYYSVQNLWQEKGEELLNKLDKNPNIEFKIKEVELFLRSTFKEHHDEDNDKWDSIIEELYYNFKSNTIQKISKSSYLSLRQFERGFKKQFGITAKEFQKITRFQEVIKSLLLNKNPAYLDTVLENGYFDQSHFIKEFKSLTQQTPLEYLTSNNFKSHFYHKSINASSQQRA
ncbi:helix-turn-helix transcriptional regulator [Hyunsoonleella sp. SJ7]|uniref:Helix-turn-helix transcriptional regulator n=1 Tax=Hyunsoonleella aquatilis TaxID=2762758 RepID=A0A923HE57_9FLAO|nr:AraC family transcriptional regulator [Hyunsoonleella aquatilis]MBC3759929.1 helix-turn-helix transcriptional regulator [Hyunsoonleella aquatilis]